MEQPITIDHAIMILNQAINSDQEAMNSLIGTRISCNTTIADHPTIQVLDEGSRYSLGILGIINGIFGTDDHQNGFIVAEFDDETGKLIRFKRMD